MEHVDTRLEGGTPVLDEPEAKQNLESVIQEAPKL